MADMDTAAKRLSTLDWDQPFQPGIPIPDGTVSAGDRQHGMWTYSGIASSTGDVTICDEFDFACALEAEPTLRLRFPSEPTLTLEC